MRDTVPLDEMIAIIEDRAKELVVQRRELDDLANRRKQI